MKKLSDFPNPSTDTKLRTRLDKLYEIKEFCECKEPFWIDGFCWECKMPCNPEELKQDAKLPVSYSRKEEKT